MAQSSQLRCVLFRVQQVWEMIADYPTCNIRKPLFEQLRLVRLQRRTRHVSKFLDAFEMQTTVSESERQILVDPRNHSLLDIESPLQEMEAASAVRLPGGSQVYGTFTAVRFSHLHFVVHFKKPACSKHVCTLAHTPHCRDPCLPRSCSHERRQETSLPGRKIRIESLQ
jgi:hypothetical protein